jgi:predicted nuclease with RNAse H fold
MLTAGVDLAAENKGTALAVIDWSGPVATLTGLQLGVADDTIAEAATTVDKLGIDCAFGWPDEFVSFIVAHADHESVDAPAVDGGMDWRRTLAYRATDREVRAKTGRWPLSVSTDRLGLTAMRCAGLLGRIQARGVQVDRSGAGRVVEIYPGASLRLWGFDTTGYRVGAPARELLLAQVLDAAPWLDLQHHAELMVRSGDAFDAVIAALATRSAALGHYDPPSPHQLARARREGWTALPTAPLAALRPA